MIEFKNGVGTWGKLPCHFQYDRLQGHPSDTDMITPSNKGGTYQSRFALRCGCEMIDCGGHEVHPGKVIRL